ncbi:MAG: B12-binding domain-containing radical SAM protein [Reyranellaceae bacterium]
MPNVLMVFPRFNQNSFWSLQAACDLYGVRCPAPPLGMITLAAMLPAAWTIRLVDRNAQTLQAADLDWADMVMTGGMLPQRIDSLAVIEMCRARGKPVVVGGPDPMSSPESYEAADFLVLGEAEGIIGEFVEAWEAGDRSGRFTGERFKVDITQSPIPRFDLIDSRNYLYVGVQFSRGCPFNCEFCDIIELFGRVPRSKTNEQMLAELQALHDTGYRGHVDFVDDNLIGNKKALRRFLPLLAQWQKERGYPFMFSTEASINLSDDGPLMEMMREANFFAIFVGIESPDTATLVSAQKKQNTRRSLADSVHRIYAHGMMVFAGFIVGFDTEKTAVADGMIDCIEATSIAVCMVGLLTALPGTQLTRRLEREGRLLPLDVGAGDQCTTGINFVPLRPRQHILEDYKAVLRNVYRPAAFFERVRTIGRLLRRPKHRRKIELKLIGRDIRSLGRLVWWATVKRPDVRPHFWRVFFATLRHNPSAMQQVMSQVVMYLHLGSFAEIVVRELDRQIDQARPATPVLAPASRVGQAVPQGALLR